MTDTNAKLFAQIRYLKSAPRHQDLPDDEGAEIAFAGRSNAGKSSALNAVTGRRNLARTSKTPGRTQALVCFEIDDHRRLIDLPGYGYASTSKQMRSHWGKAIPDYLRLRRSLVGLVLVVDIRHALKPADQQLLDWCEPIVPRVHLLLTKADKLGSSGIARGQAAVREQAAGFSNEVTVQTFSALRGEGVAELRELLAGWLAVAG